MLLSCNLFLGTFHFPVFHFVFFCLFWRFQFLLSSLQICLSVLFYSPLILWLRGGVPVCVREPAAAVGALAPVLVSSQPWWLMQALHGFIMPLSAPHTHSAPAYIYWLAILYLAAYLKMLGSEVLHVISVIWLFRFIPGKFTGPFLYTVDGSVAVCPCLSCKCHPTVNSVAALILFPPTHCYYPPRQSWYPGCHSNNIQRNIITEN